MSKQVRKANVLSTQQITPHLQRIVVGSDDVKDLTSQYIGNYVKVLFPKNGEVDFNLKTACVRSYTIRHVDAQTGALTLDFVINMHQGPATDWAKIAKVGDELGIAGPGPKKLDNYAHSHYVLLGDLTSVNAIKGYVQQLPLTSKIDAFVHAPTEQDIIDLETNRDINWVITDSADTAMLSALKSLYITVEPPIVFMALEAGLVRKAKALLIEQFNIPRSNIVSSGYWKKGVDSEGYKKQRQRDAQLA
ncbi:siderophore-interacting protein [Pseudoalteromonas sp. SG45-5]|uniref:siderophore-interacting protein n=1 Tax=unclassified Pseudoalteromonas TaxID=194690 RepID=UPI0015FB4C63|nr:MULTISPECIES: siderophore-interacting protein [unclassified Pseudoalteromonas]MBB1387343.1 siderophore-interacting protein [Pseudoalteromonas sp. SG45-5]MBB1394422.1 siderophore-interacting protein [Pseudoalteromonas sp. SG44-4]MBB1446508.1 siderophore-interacting protein [Pseudoalteromonas sp. SG41-6]